MHNAYITLYILYKMFQLKEATLENLGVIYFLKKKMAKQVYLVFERDIV